MTSSDEQPSIELDGLSDEPGFDPKVREHLEELNRYATKINQLEKLFEHENSNFHKVLTESSIQLKKLSKKCGEKVVADARPYYDALKKLKCLQTKCQAAAIKFEKYNELHLDAKQAISDTELMFHKEMRDGENFDHYWQEKLNIANSKFMEAKEERSFYEKEHEMVMAEFRAHEASISVIYKHHKSSIKRTKLYFDEADVFDSKLKSIKDNISKLENELHECKRLYSQTLKNLEQISEEIHEKRALKSLKREPGVGAELIDDQNVSESETKNLDEKNSHFMTELNEKMQKL